MLREGFEPFEQRWTNLQAGRVLAHQRLEISPQMIRIALSVSARESTRVEWSWADFGQWMGRARMWPRPARCRELVATGLQLDLPASQHQEVAEYLEALDGSKWSEERAARCALLVYVENATSRLMCLHFCDSESTFSYFEATRGYLVSHGKPVTFYSHKYSVFRVNQPNPPGGDGVTQFGRALNELNIDIICANSPAAKKRVEWANLALQGRLVKELRLQGISSIAEVPTYIADYNARFAKAPSNAESHPRPLGK